MVVKRGCKIRRILALIGEREADYLGVIFGLFVDIGHFVDRVGDLLDADHAHLRTCQLQRLPFAGGSAARTSPIAATSFSPKPISITLSYTSTARSSMCVGTPTLSANSPIMSK